MGTATPALYTYKNVDEAAHIFKVIVFEMIIQLKDKLAPLNVLKKRVNQLRQQHLARKGLIPEGAKRKLMAELETLNRQITKYDNEAKALLKNKTLQFKMPELQQYKGMNIYDILHSKFQYLGPVQFEEMIGKWEQACAKNKCNYMAVEYPEFAKPGGYQLAINAKPAFIKKALQSCGKRAVLYIDGDMFIRKYPTIFDRTEYDYMARGWNVDPRSSHNIDHSITYDPYSFETSGGIMWFSQNPEALMLADTWIETAESKFNEGKADDRVISMLFNSNKFLCPLKIVQLPIEYLWLTLDYDERMLDSDGSDESPEIRKPGRYNWEYEAMEKSKFVEHSECLTSEETAAGAGASNDRQPGMYRFIEGGIDPVSELYHEHLNFDNESQVASMKSYLDYMREAKYFNDDNWILIEKGFIDPNDPSGESNENPLYVYKFNDPAWNNRPYFMDESMTNKEVAAINSKASTMNTSNIRLDSLQVARKTPSKGSLGPSKSKTEHIAVISDFTNLQKEVRPSAQIAKKTTRKTKSSRGSRKSGTRKSNSQVGGVKHQGMIMRLIINLLEKGKSVVYNPIDEDGYDKSYYDSLINELSGFYGRADIAYVPIFNNSKADYTLNWYFKTEMSLNQPILFRPSKFIIKFLKMFLTLEDMSAQLAYGSYQFMSNARVYYILNKRKPIKTKVATKNRFSLLSNKTGSKKSGSKKSGTRKSGSKKGGGTRKKTSLTSQIGRHKSIVKLLGKYMK